MAVAITTHDNPYDPIEDFNKWFIYDSVHGYNSCGMLARLSKDCDSFSNAENESELESAIDEIIANDVLCIYKKVKR